MNSISSSVRLRLGFDFLNHPTCRALFGARGASMLNPHYQSKAELPRQVVVTYPLRGSTRSKGSTKISLANTWSANTSGGLDGGPALPVITTDVEGLEGLLKGVLEISRGLPEGSFLWYRGHSKASYKLLPSLLRDGRPSADVFERERRLLTRFRQRSLPYWPAGYPQNDWEHLFAMQHHGVPTRLLDWSENLFIATHFALERVSDAEPSLWCVDPISWNRATPVLSEYGPQIHVLTTSDEESEPYRPDNKRRRLKSPVAIFGTHNSNRIVAQRGTFMVWGEDNQELEKLAIESAANVWRFNLKGDQSALRAELNSLGFVETMVYPELTSLAAELARVEGWRA